MKCRSAVGNIPTMLAIDHLENPFSRSNRLSTFLPSNLDVPTEPFVRPSKRRGANLVSRVPESGWPFSLHNLPL